MAARQPWPPMRVDTRRGGSGPPSHPSTPVWRLWSPRYRGPCAPVGCGGALREALFPLGLPASWVPFGGGSLHFLSRPAEVSPVQQVRLRLLLPPRP